MLVLGVGLVVVFSAVGALAGPGSSGDHSNGAWTSLDGVQLHLSAPPGQRAGGLWSEFCADADAKMTGSGSWDGAGVIWTLKTPAGQVFDHPDSGDFTDAEGPFDLSTTLCWEFSAPIPAGEYQIRYWNPATGTRSAWNLHA